MSAASSHSTRPKPARELVLVVQQQLRMGMDVELEHGTHDPETIVTDDDVVVTAILAPDKMRVIAPKPVAKPCRRFASSAMQRSGIEAYLKV